MKGTSWLLVPAFVVSFAQLYGQKDFREGYIVVNHDTIRGWLSYRLTTQSTSSCWFKATEKEQPKEYLEDQLDAFGFKSRAFERITLDDKTIFARMFAKGSLSLYRYDKAFYIKEKSSGRIVKLDPPSENTFEIVDENGQKKQMSEKFYKHRTQLNALMVDCRMGAGKATYDAKSITTIIDAYNLCKKDIVKLYDDPWVKIRPYMMGGYVQSQLKLDSLPAKMLGKSYFASGGVGVEVRTPRNFDRVSFMLEALYVQSTYSGFSERTREDAVYQYHVRDEIMYNASYLKFPLSLKYDLRHHRNTVYFRAGGFFSLFVKPVQSSATRVITSVFPTEVLNFKDLNAFRAPNGVFVSIGYEKALGPVSLFAEGRAEYGTGIVGVRRTPQSNITNLALYTGLKF